MDNEILLKRAKEYIDNMANGISPITGEVLDDDNVINNVKVSRCLFYVSNVLNDVIEGNFKAYKKTSVKKTPFYMTLEEISKFQIDGSDTCISNFANEINDFLQDGSRKKLTYKDIKNWLVQNGYLIETETIENGKKKRTPTELGLQTGFRTESRLSQSGARYEVIVIGKVAKEFIIQHICEIADSVKND